MNTQHNREQAGRQADGRTDGPEPKAEDLTGFDFGRLGSSSVPFRSVYLLRTLAVVPNREAVSLTHWPKTQTIFFKGNFLVN